MTRAHRRATGAVAIVVVAIAIAALMRVWPRPPRGVAPELVPSTWSEYRATAGHEAHVGKASLECAACHDVQREGFTKPATDVCNGCHAKESAAFHRGGPGSEATDCLTCHSFAPARPEPSCLGCHAQSRDHAGAIEQHATVECARCHRMHQTPAIALADCRGCHDERATAHADHPGSLGCGDCHRGHAKASAAIQACSSCHAQPAGPHPAGHDACVDCHRPHTFEPGGAQACVRCHGEKTTLAAAAAPAHAVCTSCHVPHAPANAAVSCVGCHAGVHPDHGHAGACVTCHTPHGDDPSILAAPCTSCHQRVGTQDTDAHAGGIACTACHKPHAFAMHEPKSLCATCHAREVTLAGTNPGHGSCASCHGDSVAHSPIGALVCAACHRVEQQTAPAGHRLCEACHEPHGGAPTGNCAGCHEAEAKGIHGTLAPGGCETCHRPHGPGGTARPPSCASCHAGAALPALHAASGHAVCADCHVRPHEPPRSDRATCTASCHADRRDHQPQAAVCTGCHVFRK